MSEEIQKVECKKCGKDISERYGKETVQAYCKECTEERRRKLKKQKRKECPECGHKFTNSELGEMLNDI